jgi:hypothetical protein
VKATVALDDAVPRHAVNDRREERDDCVRQLRALTHHSGRTGERQREQREPECVRRAFRDPVSGRQSHIPA